MMMLQRLPRADLTVLAIFVSLVWRCWASVAAAVRLLFYCKDLMEGKPLKEEDGAADACDGGPPAGDADAAAPAVKAGFLELPDTFCFGAATAAYQIEGAASEGGRGSSIWDDLLHSQAQMQTGDVACDHYHRFKDDVEIMSKIGLKAYRFSISWSRLIPGGEGEVNGEGSRFYSDLIDELLAHGIEPWVTIYHWDLPSALNAEFKGWLGPKDRIVGAFASYARTCFQLYGDRVKHWITLNEPFCAAMDYSSDEDWPATKGGRSRDPYTAAHHMLLAHCEAARIYRSDFQEAQGGQIGMALNSDWAHPASRASAAAAQRAREFQLGWFADPVYFGDYPASMRAACGARLPAFTAEESAAIKGSTDFFGVNNYFTKPVFPAPPADSAGAKLLSMFFSRFGLPHMFSKGWDGDRAAFNLLDDPGWEKTDVGWPIVPWGLRDLLLYIQRHYAPRGGIAILENGCAHEPAESKALEAAQPHAPRPCGGGRPEGEDLDAATFEDPERIRYLRAHLSAVHAARSAGADVRAYFAWSLLDNLEWRSGYKLRFGLVRVDFRTQQRTIKGSGRFYGRVIRDGGLEAPPKSEQYKGFVF